VLVQEAHFLNGEYDGPFQTWWDNGKPKEVGAFASGKRVVADLKVVDEEGHPANTPIGAFANPVLEGGEILAPTGSGDSASVALYVSSGHFDFLAAHRAQWDRLLVRVQPPDSKDAMRLAITGYTFTDRKARLK